MLVTSLPTLDLDGVQSVVCCESGRGFAVSPGLTVSFRIGEEAVCKVARADLVCKAAPEGAVLMHITARKKSTVLLMRLLLKSNIRPDPWTPDLSTLGKSSNFPHASVGTLAPVAVKS